jgi:hypothetical protein
MIKVDSFKMLRITFVEKTGGKASFPVFSFLPLLVYLAQQQQRRQQQQEQFPKSKMRPKRPATREERRRLRSFNKNSLKATVKSPHHETSTHADSTSDATPDPVAMADKLSISSQIEKITTYFHKIDTTKFLLGFLMTIAIILMQYEAQQERNESTTPSSFETTTLKSNNGVRSFNSAFDDLGHQAQSQVPIPMEYSHFVELSEFADVVEALRTMHREKHLQQQNHYTNRRLQENAESDTNLGQDDDEEAQLYDAMDAAWDQTMQQADPSHIQQVQSYGPAVKHVPFFWHIPRSGGTSFSTLFGTCLGLVQAASSYSAPAIYTRWEDKELANRFKDPTLYVVSMKKQRFVNVDLNDLQGVMRAVKGNLISSELADLVMVQDVSMGSFLLEEGRTANVAQSGENKPEFKGVLFAMFRHPVERAISSFYSKQQVRDVNYDPSLAIYSLTDWANSPQYINDYMVRSLVGKLNERSPQNQPALSRTDLDVAKEILRRKCLVGLLDEKTESLKRFEKFFGWNAEARHNSMVMLDGEETAERAQAEIFRKEIVKDEECKDKLLHYNWEKKHTHPSPEEGDMPYKLLESKNRYDIELYIYARQLYDDQYSQLGFDDDSFMER